MPEQPVKIIVENGHEFDDETWEKVKRNLEKDAADRGIDAEVIRGEDSG